MGAYDNDDRIIAEIKNRWNRNLKSTRIWGFVAAILMIIVGALCIVYPVETTYTVEIMASIAMFCFGMWEIVEYLQRPVFLRMGTGLASGILNMILGIMLLTSPAEDMFLYFGFLFGLDLMMLGFEQITAAGRIKAVGVTETGWMTFNGILNIIFGLILLFMPMASIEAVSVILAVYLIFGGISLLVISFNAKELKA